MKKVILYFILMFFSLLAILNAAPAIKIVGSGTNAKYIQEGYSNPYLGTIDIANNFPAFDIEKFEDVDFCGITEVDYQVNQLDLDVWDEAYKWELDLTVSATGKFYGEDYSDEGDSFNVTLRLFTDAQEEKVKFAENSEIYVNGEKQTYNTEFDASPLLPSQFDFFSPVLSMQTLAYLLTGEYIATAEDFLNYDIPSLLRGNFLEIYALGAPVYYAFEDQNPATALDSGNITLGTSSSEDLLSYMQSAFTYLGWLSWPEILGIDFDSYQVSFSFVAQDLVPVGSSVPEPLSILSLLCGIFLLALKKMKS